MTAINIIANAGGAMIFTDGVVSREGVVTCIGSKVVRYPHLMAAAAATGSTLAGNIAQTYMGKGARDYDELVAGMVEAVEEGLRENAEWIAEGGDREFDIHTVGYSPKASGYLINSCAYAPGGKPELRPATRLVLAPGDERLMAMLDNAGIAPTAIFEMSLDGQRDTMAEIMRIQRKDARERGEAIGAFQELTILSAAGAHSMLLDIWPDRIGERIAA